MADFQLDDSGDLVLSADSPDIQMISGEEELLQKCKLVLATRLGEFKPEETFGLSHDNLFGKFIDQDGLEQDIQDAFENQLPEVDSVTIDSVDLDSENRSMKVSITISSSIIETGEASIETEVDTGA